VQIGLAVRARRFEFGADVLVIFVAVVILVRVIVAVGVALFAVRGAEVRATCRAIKPIRTGAAICTANYLPAEEK
jgi:hypothetical protein